MVEKPAGCYNHRVIDTPSRINNDSPKESKKFSFVPFLILTLVAYVGFLLYQAVYFNYKTSQKIKTLKNQLVDLDSEKQKLESLIAYYQTDTFAELEARKKLGMRMPGEKAIKVDVPEDQASLAKEQNQQKPVTQPAIPNWQKWVNYLEGRDF